MSSSKPVSSDKATNTDSQFSKQFTITVSDVSTATNGSTKAPPDPDSEGAVWFEPESHTAVIARHDNPVDQSGLMSLRDVLRNRRSIDNAGSIFMTASKFSPNKIVSAMTGAVTTPRAVSLGTPPSAWAKPAVEVSMQAADGTVSGLPETVESAEKILLGMDAANDNNPNSFSWKSPTTDLSVRRRRAPSTVSTESESTETVPSSPPDDAAVRAALTEDAPSSTDAGTEQTTLTTDQESASESQASSVASLRPHGMFGTTTTKSSKDSSRESVLQQQSSTLHQQAPTTSSFSTSLASTVTNAMRYLMNPNEISRPASPAHHHKLLALDSQPAFDRPHIRYEWTVGKHLKFSCTVYYAKQFETLRRRCGVEDVFPKSLARSTNWAAEGGKSRSNFWKTLDERFVVKTLVNAWNVADLYVFVNFLTAEIVISSFQASLERDSPILFPLHGEHFKQADGAREAPRILHNRNQESGVQQRPSKSRPPRHGEPVLRPEYHQDVRFERNSGEKGEDIG